MSSPSLLHEKGLNGFGEGLALSDGHTFGVLNGLWLQHTSYDYIYL